jgi:FkbM family methyltransferase
MRSRIGNRYNWVGMVRAFGVVTNPIAFLWALGMHRVPKTATMRTPTGKLTLKLRNYESVKTLFGVFCRDDYATPAATPAFFLDIGANIGYASAYFLSRNPANLVRCFEPDETNLECLRENLAQFGNRATIVNRAVTPETGETVIYRAADGKHSALHANELATTPQTIATRAFDEILAEPTPTGLPLVVKLDVEGIEEELVKSVDFTKHKRLTRLLCESLFCSALIARPHRREIRNGYVEDLRFG